VVLCGPGLGLGQRTGRLVEALLAGWSGPLVLDADALTELAAEPARLEALRARGDDGVTVLTPHPGEAARLLLGLDRLTGEDVPAGDLGRDPVARLRAAERLASELCAVVVLKGAGTVVHDGERAWICGTGNPGMASGGTGDVLAGIAAALLVPHAIQDADPYDLVRAAVHLHGLAGDRVAARLGRRALLAGDLLDELGPAETEGPWAG